tara:strand:+ start:29 stop:1207 length:1179 start_codon:yes stop_codon:yes gene_type:complete
MTNSYQRAGDCKSSIREFDSHPRLHSLSEDKQEYWLNLSIAECGFFIMTLPQVDIPITIVDRGKYIAVKYQYKGHKKTTRLNITASEIKLEDVFTLVKIDINEIDGIVTLKRMLSTYLEKGSGHIDTRKKVVSNAKHYFKMDNIPLDEPTTRLLVTDELGRTLPERWQDLFNLPHKLRQVRSIFGRKNILLFKKMGWDTKPFGNFVTFVAETTVSQPFSTSDAEVDHIIKFFNNAKDQHPIFYNIYLLAFGCGLRKSEIYQVKHENFTTFNGQHFLLLPFSTKRTKLKGINIVEKVPVSEQVFNHFKLQSGQKNSARIVEGGERLHRRFIKFLKKEVGIKENKACHRLRKILGARLATEHGIYHAAKQLRNSVQVAERYYSDLTSHRNELEV